MELKEAISKLTTELKNNSEYREGWIANIAMSYKYCERWYKEKTGKRQLNKKDVHIIANNAAEHFLKQLCAGVNEVESEKSELDVDNWKPSADECEYIEWMNYERRI